MSKPRPKRFDETQEQYDAVVQQFMQNQRNRLQRMNQAKEERRKPTPIVSKPKPVDTPVTPPTATVDPRDTVQKTLPKIETKRKPIVERKPIQPDPPKDASVAQEIVQEIKPATKPKSKIAPAFPAPLFNEMFFPRKPKAPQQGYVDYGGLAAGQGFYGSSAYSDLEKQLNTITPSDRNKYIVKKFGGYYSKYFDRQPTARHAELLDQAYEKFLAEKNIKPPQANRMSKLDEMLRLIERQTIPELPTRPTPMPPVLPPVGDLPTQPTPRPIRNPHIQPDFYNSPEFKEYSKIEIGTMDMYYSPYFGRQGSGSMGRALDRAYEAWAKRTGNEAIKGPPRKSILPLDKMDKFVDIADSEGITTPVPRDPTKPIQNLVSPKLRAIKTAYDISPVNIEELSKQYPNISANQMEQFRKLELTFLGDLNRELNSQQNYINNTLLEQQMSQFTGKPKADIEQIKKSMDLNTANRIEQFNIQLENRIRKAAGQEPLSEGMIIKRLRAKIGEEVFPTPRQRYIRAIQRIRQTNFPTNILKRNALMDARIMLNIGTLIERGVNSGEAFQRTRQKFPRYFAYRERRDKIALGLSRALRKRGLSLNDRQKRIRDFISNYRGRPMKRNRGGYISAPPQIKGTPTQSVDNQMLQFGIA